MDLNYEIAKAWFEAFGVAIQRIMQHEGFRSKPYRDTVGKLTIGYGRNLDDVGISEQEGMMLLQNDLEKVAKQLDELSKDGTITLDLDSSTQAHRVYVIVEMVFNLGIAGFKKFKRLIDAINKQDWEAASKSMLESKWATQVGQRAKTLAEVMRTGKIEDGNT